MASIIVFGGAGYIGSHAAKALSRAGHAVTVFDNLSTGHRGAVRFGRFVQGDLRRRQDLDDLFRQETFDAVMHFAACCYVGESVGRPGKYYENNVVGTLNLLETMRATGVARLVFSSSCATYGDPLRMPIDESHPQNPVNPYGVTKFVAERAMADYGRAYGLRTVALRYFNAAGCDLEGELGERHDPETHLIPLVLREALRLRAGGRSEDTGLRMNGEDFDTPDGSCVRDYVHVSDLCDAHLLALQRLMDGRAVPFDAFNLGNERGISVKEVVAVCREVTGIDIRYVVGDRRPGDPPALVADSRSAREVLGWAPRHEKLTDIVRTAWNWFATKAPA
jgi:UDP-glucose-4-epimerase GalE